MKEDEKKFFKLCYKMCRKECGLSFLVPERGLMPRDIIRILEEYGQIHHKRAWYLLGKWSDKGLYTYGVTLDLGWFTNKFFWRDERYLKLLEEE